MKVPFFHEKTCRQKSIPAGSNSFEKAQPLSAIASFKALTTRSINASSVLESAS